MSPLLCRISGLSVSYRRTGRQVFGLRALSLEIATGEILAVIGESGSGKSTLARTIAGLLPAGAVVDGQIDWPDTGHAPVPGKELGFVFQDPGSSLNPVMTIGEQIAEGARQHLALSWRQSFGRAGELLRQVGLPQPEAMLRAYPHQLSGGQRQRVAIAAAIAARPRLLIADEVTSALDMVVQAAIVTLLRELVRTERMTLLFITHDMALASTLADRIAVLRDGRLVECGTAAQVLSRPASPYTAGLIAAHVDLDTRPLVAEPSR